MRILKKIKKAIKYIIIGLLCLFLINWSSALIKCELLTIAHYDEFKDAYKENTMLGDMEYFKVLSYKPYKSSVAQVYYVGKDNSGGDVLTFTYNHETDKWDEISWATIWSGIGGSASEVIWPYLWHFIYGGL